EVTAGALEIWRTLPEKIRQDPSLASFRQEHERLGLGDVCDEIDPLPNDDNPNEEEEDRLENENSGRKMDYLSINVATVASRPNNGQKAQFSAPANRDASTVEGDLDQDTDEVTGHRKLKPWIKSLKIGLLLGCWLLFTAILMTKNERVETLKQISIPVGKVRSFILPERLNGARLQIELSGAFLPEHYGNLSINYIELWLEILEVSQSVDPANASHLKKHEVLYIHNISDASFWRLPIVSEDLFDIVPELTRRRVFTLGSYPSRKIPDSVARVRMRTNAEANFPLSIGYDVSPIDMDDGVIYAAVVLLGLYILIVFEIVHRTFAAILASTMSVAILAALNERPTMSELISWIDVETLLLLFSMMVLVAIFSETGIFDFLAVYAYKITSGRIWPLINCLCLFTAIMSSFLDNVTTVLLMTPVTIRLCEVMELNPVPILMSMIIYSNIGGALTPVGDPPNVIIASNSHISQNGVNFTTFTMHMAIGVLLVMVQTYFQLRLKFRNINNLRFSEPHDVQELRHEIAVWQRAAASLSSYSKDEDLVRETLTKKVQRLLAQLKKKLLSGSVPFESYKANLEELQQKYPIRNKVLLVKSGITLVFVISFFFLHSVPELQRLSLGWTALLGALLLLILADREDMESVLARVEWTTLLFFAALFVLMEALSKLGLIDWIGKQTEAVILSVSEESRLAVAILLILWVSAIASAFVDNIPLTTMMVKIAISLAENEELGLPLQPLVWALAFGACLGGNGTLIGASANVVCAGVAEQHGYRFTFVEYFKVGFPVMIGSILVTTVYLMIAHVALQWH
ncbi:P protein-like, partial [Ctenocephalides felis]